MLRLRDTLIDRLEPTPETEASGNVTKRLTLRVCTDDYGGSYPFGSILTVDPGEEPKAGEAVVLCDGWFNLELGEAVMTDKGMAARTLAKPRRTLLFGKYAEGKPDCWGIVRDLQVGNSAEETHVQLFERYLGTDYLTKHPDVRAKAEADDAEDARRKALTPEEREAEDDAKEEAELAEHIRLRPLFIKAMIAEDFHIGEIPEGLYGSTFFSLGEMFPEIRDNGTICTLYLLMQELLQEAKEALAGAREVTK